MSGMDTFTFNAHWQIAGASQDKPIEGIDDINLCIEHILSTRKGTDILRPQFGSNHFDYIDQPTDVAIPNIVREVIVALEMWEKRIVVEKVEVQDLAPQVILRIFYRLRDDVSREIYGTTVSNG